MVLLVRDLLLDQQAREADKLARYIEGNPGVSRREIARATGRRTAEITTLTEELQRQGRIEVKPDGNRTTYLPAGGSSRAIKTGGGVGVSGVGSSGGGQAASDPPMLPTPDSLTPEDLEVSARG